MEVKYVQGVIRSQHRENVKLPSEISVLDCCSDKKIGKNKS